MPRWVRSYWDEEDVTFFWEVGDDGWVTRSVELHGRHLEPRVAACLTEVIAARDGEGVAAVQRYEDQFGVLVEKPISDWDFPHEPIDISEFEARWAEAREVLGGTGTKEQRPRSR